MKVRFGAEGIQVHVRLTGMIQPGKKKERLKELFPVYKCLCEETEEMDLALPSGEHQQNDMH